MKSRVLYATPAGTMTRIDMRQDSVEWKHRKTYLKYLAWCGIALNVYLMFEIATALVWAEQFINANI